MAVKLKFALTVLLIGTCFGAGDDFLQLLAGLSTTTTTPTISTSTADSNITQDYLDGLIMELFKNVSTTTSTIAPKLLKNEVIPPCGVGEKCIPESNCIHGKVNRDSNIQVINVRFINENNGTACTFLHRCCSVVDTDTSSTPIARSAKISLGCGYRNVDGVGITIPAELANRTSEFGEFPWMLAILRAKTESDSKHDIYQCGGSLIHPKVALTAAHCVTGWRPSSFTVRAGEWESNTKNEPLLDENRAITDIVIHPQFSKNNLHNDVALLFLKSPFVLAPHINTVCLPPAGFNFDFSKCFATGWGKDQFENGEYANILKKVQLPVVPNNVCQENLRQTVLGEYYRIHESFLCAGGEKDKDTCEGDGGSPLVCPLRDNGDIYYQAGIVAWGIGCGKENVPGVYVNISKFSTWIDEEIAKTGISIGDYLAIPRSK